MTIAGLPEYALFIREGQIALLSLDNKRVVKTWKLEPITKDHVSLSALNQVLETFVESLVGFHTDNDGFQINDDRPHYVAAFTASLLVRLNIIAKEDANG